jgi:hypothetical protein
VVRSVPVKLAIPVMIHGHAMTGNQPPGDSLTALRCVYRAD